MQPLLRDSFSGAEGVPYGTGVIRELLLKREDLLKTREVLILMKEGPEQYKGN